MTPHGVISLTASVVGHCHCQVRFFLCSAKMEMTSRVGVYIQGRSLHYKNKWQEILPVDSVSYIVGRSDELEGMDDVRGYKKSMPVEWPLLAFQ
jgi:hypothetical protein